MTVIERDNSKKRMSRADDLAAYKIARISVYTYGMGLDLVDVGTLASHIAGVVKVEGPVHIREVFRRVAEGAGVKRVGSRIEAALQNACARAVHQKMVHRRGDFLWPSADTKPMLRSRAGVQGISPRLEMVPPEEIELAILHAIADGHGLEEEKVYHAACELLGYARVGDEMRTHMHTIIEGMLKRRTLVRRGGTLLLGSTK